jgi:hypothetical protein
VSGFELVAVVIGIFFTTGLAAGALLVIAVGTLRRREDGRYLENQDWQALPPPPPEDEKPPWWQDG